MFETVFVVISIYFGTVSPAVVPVMLLTTLPPYICVPLSRLDKLPGELSEVAVKVFPIPVEPINLELFDTKSPLNIANVCCKSSFVSS